ncbi:MAG: HlyC/CorC family transporter [Actinobacteria bacterium]|nr:HlyC/CorC family transporter [Actinomycetota bacterium]
MVAATAVFVAAEFALVAADRSKVNRAADGGDKRARIVQGLLRRMSFHLSGAQLGITITSLVLGFVSEPTIARLLEPVLYPLLPDAFERAVSITVALLIATFAAMVLGELVPKTLSIAHPEATTYRLARFLRIYGVVFGPIISVLNRAANWLVRKLGIEPKEELSSVRSLSELTLVVQASAEEGALAGNASRLFARSVRFSEKTAADVLVPRVEIVAIGREDSLQDLVAAAATSGHSRFPVFGSDLDDIVGVVHVKQVHDVPADERCRVAVASIMQPIVAVPETRDLQSLLIEMRDERTHLVVVVDEYGGTAGIVALEDLLEEIVGEIDDEYDPLTPSLTHRLPSGSYVVSGSLHPDEVLDATGFAMPRGEYETLAGFVLEQLGHLPQPGEAFEREDWRLVVEEMDKRRVARVRIEPRQLGNSGVREP